MALLPYPARNGPRPGAALAAPPRPQGAAVQAVSAFRWP